MRILSRIAIAAAVAAGTFATPAQATTEPWPWVCVRYPCYPTDYVEYLLGDEVTVTFNDMVVCVTEPCEQPPPVTVCVKRAEYCTDQ